MSCWRPKCQHLACSIQNISNALGPIACMYIAYILVNYISFLYFLYFLYLESYFQEEYTLERNHHRHITHSCGKRAFENIITNRKRAQNSVNTSGFWWKIARGPRPVGRCVWKSEVRTRARVPQRDRMPFCSFECEDGTAGILECAVVTW